MGVQLLIPHRLQVSSYGGAGTSLLIDFLRRAGLSLPREPDCGRWKHLRRPPQAAECLFPPHFRGVYLYADPAASVFSLFRRGYYAHHVRRMSLAASPEWLDWPESLPLVQPPSWGLNEYLSFEADLFGLERHFLNWTTSPFAERGYPILLLRYETLWRHLELLFDFVGVHRSLQRFFPPYVPRQSLAQRRNPLYLALEARYAALQARIEARPEFEII